MTKVIMKIVTIEFVAYGYYPARFIDYIFEDGRHVYVARGYLTTKEAGNELFLSLKKERKVKTITAKTKVADLEKEIEAYEKAIDPYTCYIDDYRQEQAAIKENERLYAIINALRGNIIKGGKD